MKNCRHTLDGSQAGDEGGTAGRRGAGAVEASSLVHGRGSLNRDLVLEVCRAKCAEWLENDDTLRAVRDLKPSFPDDRLNSRSVLLEHGSSSARSGARSHRRAG